MNNFLTAGNPQMYLFLVWSLGWKGWALWRASKNSQRYWYLAMLVINTVGLVEIIYLVFFQKQGRLWEKIVAKLPLKKK